MRKTLSVIIVISGFITLATFSQLHVKNTNFSISGTIQSDSLQPISVVEITAIPVWDATWVQSATTDANGSYQLNYTFVGLSQTQALNEPEIWVYKQGNEYQVLVHSKLPVQQADIYSITGQKLTIASLNKTGNSTYSGTFQTSNYAIVLIKAGTKALKYCTHSHFLKNEKLSTTYPLSLKNMELTSFRFLINHPDSAFQAIDTTINNIDTASTLTQDFEMNSWPIFEAWLSVGVSNPDTGIVFNANIWLNDLTDTTIVYKVPPFNAGMVYATAIPVPHTSGNRRIPDTTQYQINVTGQGYKLIKDTIALSHGTYSRGYTLEPL